MLVDAELSQKSSQRALDFPEKTHLLPLKPETVFMWHCSVFVKKRVNPTAGAFQKPTSASQLLSFLELLEEICQVRKIKASFWVCHDGLQHSLCDRIILFQKILLYFYILKFTASAKCMIAYNVLGVLRSEPFRWAQG